MLTTADIFAEVERIRAIVADDVGDEEAHEKEDALYLLVLRAIRDGTCDDPAECAAAVLKTKEIDFERWYA